MREGYDDRAGGAGSLQSVAMATFVTAALAAPLAPDTRLASLQACPRADPGSGGLRLAQEALRRSDHETRCVSARLPPRHLYVEP